MDGVNRLTRVMPGAIAAIILVFLLSACSNPVDFRASVIDEVKLANKLYLVVDSVDPGDNSQDINPFGSLRIEFDREIDPATVSAASISITDDAAPPAAVSWTQNYDSGVLTITPLALESLTWYTVSVTGEVKGTDGSSLRQPYTWKFKTLQAPGGSVVINDGDTYTNSTSVSLTIGLNSAVTHYRVSVTDPPSFDPGGFDYIAHSGPGSISINKTLTAGDGPNKVYVQFMDSSENPDVETPSTAIFDAIILDTTKPEVDAGTLAWLNKAYPSRRTEAVVSDATSGIASYLWSGSGLTFSKSATIPNPSISASADGTFTATLTVTDRAGNSNSDTLTVNRDVLPPTVNVGTLDWLNVASASRTTSATASDATSGIASYEWTGPAELSFSPDNTLNTTISGTTDGTYTANLKVTDVAGNYRNSSLTVNRDRVKPAVTAFTIGSGNPASTNLPSVTLYITATDATSGVSQARYGNLGYAWTAYEAYGTTKAWTLEDKAGTRRAYVQVKDAAGNESTLNADWDEILLNARIVVTYSQLYISDDGDMDVIVPAAGEIYYYFYIDGVTKLYRTEANYLPVTSPYLITSQLPPSSFTIYKDPASSFTMTGTVYDDDSPLSDDYGIMSPITYSIPALVDVPSAARSISGGDVAGALYYSIDYVNP
jgi:hypothetical protein